MINCFHQKEGNFLKLKNRKLKIMSNKETYCLKASSQQLARLAELMDERSRATGFDEPVVYLGTPYLLDPIPFSGSEKTCDTPRIFSACLVDESRAHDLSELVNLLNEAGIVFPPGRTVQEYFNVQKVKFCGEYVSTYCAYIYVPEN